MGRSKVQGPKNLAKVIQNPRYVKALVTARGKSGTLTMSDVIAAGLAARGYVVDGRTD